jgi:hypothetical protein
MSLILEALRKLEREKPDQTRQTTVLLAPLAWPAPARGRGLTIAASVILVAAVAVAAWFLLKGHPQPAGTPSASAPLQQPAPAPVPPTAPTPTAAQRPAPAAHLAQPSARRVAPKPAPQHEAISAGFHLTAIGDRDGVSVAVLNDRLVRVGDSLSGARVVRISESEVELESEVDGHRFILGF